MSRSTISAFELSRLFPNEAAAMAYIEKRFWPNGAVCPKCRNMERVTKRKDGFYSCNACVMTFTVRTGTIFERSHIPLHKWLVAMYLLVTARKGISSVQLSKQIGIRQASAWFLLHRLREACGPKLAMLCGIVEVDEVFFGGKEHNKHMKQRVLYRKAGKSFKTAVIGMRERGGRSRAFTVKGVTTTSLVTAVRQNVLPGAEVHSDEYIGYRPLMQTHVHKTVNHSKEEFSRNGVTTNSVESMFAVMRRGLHGVYHHASQKHMCRYVNEFAWRLDEGSVERHTLDRLDSFLDAAAGRRITYKNLIA